MKRSLSTPLVVTVVASLAVLPPAAQASGRFLSPTSAPATLGAIQPDAWIRLCGAGDAVGCKEARYIPRTPFKGNNIYNTTGFKQTASGYVNEGADIRFWVAFQNDGTSAVTLMVKGCRGGPVWEVRQVIRGKYKYPRYGPGIVLTDDFRNGTLATRFAAGSHKVRYLTIDIWEHIRGPGMVFRCPITVSAKSDPSLKDTVVARSITY
jgi:hypothetical protein